MTKKIKGKKCRLSFQVHLSLLLNTDLTYKYASGGIKKLTGAGVR